MSESNEQERIKFSDLPSMLESHINPNENYLVQRSKIISILQNTDISQEDYLPFKFVNLTKKYTRNLVV